MQYHTDMMWGDMVPAIPAVMSADSLPLLAAGVSMSGRGSSIGEEDKVVVVLPTTMAEPFSVAPPLPRPRPKVTEAYSSLSQRTRSKQSAG